MTVEPAQQPQSQTTNTADKDSATIAANQQESPAAETQIDEIAGMKHQQSQSNDFDPAALADAQALFYRGQIQEAVQAFGRLAERQTQQAGGDALDPRYAFSGHSTPFRRVSSYLYVEYILIGMFK